VHRPLFRRVDFPPSIIVREIRVDVGSLSGRMLGDGGKFLSGHPGQRAVDLTQPVKGRQDRARGHALRRCDSTRCRQRGHDVRLATLARDASVLVLVLGFAGCAPGLLDLRADHRHDDVIREASLARTVVIEDVTKPKLALLHQELPNGTSLAGKGIAKGVFILAELLRGWQYRPSG
jgi:hypothetical protein